MSLKRTVAGIATGLILTSTNAFAILGMVDVDVGTGVWAVGGSGAMTGTSNGAEAKVDFDYPMSYDNYYFTARIDHFVPLVPNVKIDILQHHMVGTISGGITYDLFGQTYKYEAAEAVDVTYMQQDYTLYWGVPFLNALTLGMLDLNAGLNLKNIVVGTMSDVMDSGTTTVGMLVPMYDVTAMVDLPVIPKVEATYRSLFGIINDISGKVVVELPIPVPMVHFNVEAGYRIQTIDSEAIDSADNEWLKTTTGVFVDWTKIPTTAITYQGVFAGLNIAF
jgi:outer membrane protein